MVRNLPAVPVVGSGNQPFQPLWFEDLAQAIRMAANDRSLNRQVLELAGNEVVTTREVLDCLTELTGRSPERIPVPEWAAKIGTLVADNLFSKTLARIGLHLPLNSSKLQMLVEGNVIDSPDRNALISVFRISPTPLREGLISLADRLPELLLEDGIGPIERKRFWAEVCDSRMSHTQLMRFFREHITEVIPVNFAAEPNVPSEASLGATLTGAIPGRGFFQVRVEEETPDSITLATLEGHPLAGLITFKCQPHGEKVQFMVELYAHPSNFIDWLGMHLAGAPLQNQNWRQLVARVVELTGGLCPEGVQCDSKLLDEAEAEQVERRADDLVCARKREEHRAELSRA